VLKIVAQQNSGNSAILSNIASQFGNNANQLGNVANQIGVLSDQNAQVNETLAGEWGYTENQILLSQVE